MNAFLLPIRFSVKKSKCLDRIYQCLLLLVATLVLLAPDLTLFYKAMILLLFMLIPWSGNVSMEAFVGYEILLGQDGAITLINLDQESRKLTLMNATFIHPLISLLSFRLENGENFRLCLVQDNIDKETFRRLRVRLLHQKLGA